MNYELQTTNYHHSTLAWRKTGHGATALLAFHGFGQDHRAFEPLAASLADRYTLYAFDLFFHGGSVWAHGETPLEKDHWKAMLSLFLEENQIGRFSLAGFSLGAKFALATLEAFPERTDSVFLLAPDGIKTYIWYSLATYPIILRRFFKSIIDHPRRLTTLIQLANKLGLADRSLLRFAENQMNTREKRTRVYCSWVVFRYFRFTMATLARVINEHPIAVTVVAGRYDRIITPARMGRLLKRLKRSEFRVLEAGHHDLIRNSIDVFR